MSSSKGCSCAPSCSPSPFLRVDVELDVVAFFLQQLDLGVKLGLFLDWAGERSGGSEREGTRE